MTVFETMFLTWGFLGILFFIYLYVGSNTDNELIVLVFSLFLLGPYMVVAVILFWIVTYILAFIVYLKFLKADEEELKALKEKRNELHFRCNNPIKHMFMKAYDYAFHWWNKKTNKE